MKSISILVSAAALSVGLLGGTLAYQASSAPVRQDSTASAAPSPASAAARHHQKPVVRWAPCKPPATRVGKACVTDDVRTVVVPAPAAAPVAQPVRTTRSAAVRYDEHGDDERGDDEHGDDEHGDDEHESDGD